MRNPLPLVALLYAAGVVLGKYLPGPRPLWLLALSLTVALLALFGDAARRIILCVLLPLVGWTDLAVRTAVLSPHDLRLILGPQPEYVTLRATLAETPVLRLSTRRERVLERCVAQIQAECLLRKGLWQPAFGQVIASTPGLLDGRFYSGRKVEVTGILQRPKGPNAPGQFDYRAYLQNSGIYFQLRTESTNDWRLAIEPGTAGAAARPFCDRFTEWAQRTLAKGLTGEDESLRLLWAMVLGWKTALTQEVAEPFMQSGTLHIFAISGLHIALISGILVSLLRVLRVPRGASGWVVIPLIWFYTAATGWQPSAIRSTVMMSVVIAGWALERPSNLLNSLAAAGLIILIWDPRQLFQASFQLSFFVVLGIALLVPPLEGVRQKLLAPDPLLPPELRPRWKRWLDWPMRVVTTSLATSLAAWLGSMPLIAYYFYMITPGSLLANLVIVPLSSLALMSSLGSLVCGSWLPFVSELFNHSSWLWMELMIRLSQWFASLPGAYFNVPAPSLVGFATYYLLLGGLLSGIFYAPRTRSWALMSAALLMAGWLCCRLVHRNEISMTILPVRSGAIFVDPPGHESDLLVDCSDAVTAESLIKPFLRSQGINRLAGLLFTHGDVYHVGGAQIVLDRFRPNAIFTSTAPSRSPAYRQLVAHLEKTSNGWRRLQRGEQVSGWTVLHPSEGDRFPQASASVVVLRGRFHGVEVLTVSDLGRPGTRTLLEREADLKADILIGGFSASSDAFSDVLIQAVQPRLLIVACAEYPAAARPSSRLRERLAALRIPVIYTSDAGAAILSLHPDRWEIRTMDGRRASASGLAAYLPPIPEPEPTDSDTG